MKIVRVQNNVVVEIMVPVERFTLEECFHPNIIAMCETVDDTVELGWVRQEDGTFVDPNATEAPEATEEPTPEPA